MAKKITQYTAVTQPFIPTDLIDVSKHITQTLGILIVGKQYTILDYQVGDDFTNVANVVSGTINTTGCVFIATGTTPTNYMYSSTIAYYESQKATIAQIGGLPKIYKALLTQSGTSAPVVVSNGTGANTPLANTLGATPSFSYDTTGEFYLNCVGMFPDQAKVIINCPPLNGTNDEGVKIAWNDSDSLYIQTFKAGANFNGLLNYYSIVIEVYP